MKSNGEKIRPQPWFEPFKSIQIMFQRCSSLHYLELALNKLIM